MPNIYRDKSFIEIQKLVNLSIFVSIAIMLSVLESLIPVSFVIPGIKVGLSNIVLLLILPFYSYKELFFFQFTKITVTSFLLGLFSIYLFSIIAGIVALTVMYIIYKIFLGVTTVYTISILGAVTHNITQLIVAMIYVQSILPLNYILLLVISGVIMGFIIGYIVDKKLNIIQRKLNNDSIKEFFS